MGRYLESAALLGRRTAELHQALAGPTFDPAFAPEPLTPLHQRSLYQSLRNTQQRTLHELLVNQGRLPTDAQPLVQEVLGKSEEMLRRFGALVSRRLGGQRIRCHGNLGLGELLFTGKDFVIIDFEGEPERPLGERRVKRLPFGDLATMVRSFHHAALMPFLGDGDHRGRTPGMIRSEDVPLLEPWAELWFVAASTEFIRAYQEHTAQAPFLPATGDDFESLLADFLLERALWELALELEARPAWAVISLRAIVQLIAAPQPAAG